MSKKFKMNHDLHPPQLTTPKGHESTFETTLDAETTTNENSLYCKALATSSVCEKVNLRTLI